ncbi:lasso peptide biosynthesis protein [Vibrio cholerae]|uniref:lasso peptide biosynthesis protein n=1 Tax=Vibrio cholerae TaxID=666 RepID=UPI00084E08E5|nr:lasso peptide biosynthesis protein [Vibrio cholerae]EJO4031803.1 lasso peptide biosynthesis protein [Vibrio cholerae]ELH0844914.1 lasso peptide biosynthesis protein [Vibrio cholerae]ELT6289785.1 lasso peptide biosynthesis protein [Vibrio cholerae]OEG76712.1 hypothetical protein VCS12_14880 [Vibrio cholerae]
MNENVIAKSMSELIIDKSWGGACYASTAMMHTILKLVGIDSDPCIGVVKCRNGDIFDHAWLEVNGKKYDVAIPFPMGNSKVSLFVNREGFMGAEDTPNFEYGINMDLDPEASFVAEKFTNIMDQSPFWYDGVDYWDVAEFVAEFHHIKSDKQKLEKAVEGTQWKVVRKLA